MSSPACGRGWRSAANSFYVSAFAEAALAAKCFGSAATATVDSATAARCAANKLIGNSGAAPTAATQQQAQNQPNNRTGFETQDQAAAAALQNSNGASIKNNKEYAGLIYKDKNDGKYHYTGPVGGTDQGSNPHDAKAPKGSKAVGDYHTHGDYSTLGPNGSAVRTHDPHHDDFNSNHFSGGDKQGIAHDATGKPAYRGYLGTPSGRFLVYNPSTGQEGPLQ